MNPDLSVLLVVLMVWTLYFVLRKFFFDPINRILSQRDAAIHGTQEEARRRLIEVDKKSKAHSDSLKEARSESYRQQEGLRTEALKERSQILAQGRKGAEQVVGSAKQEIEEQVTIAKRTLQSEINEIADGIVKSILR